MFVEHPDFAAAMRRVSDDARQDFVLQPSQPLVVEVPRCPCGPEVRGGVTFEHRVWGTAYRKVIRGTFRATLRGHFPGQYTASYQLSCCRRRGEVPVVPEGASPPEPFALHLQLLGGQGFNAWAYGG